VEHAVPIHEDPPTARALYATTRIGEEIPHDQYRAVATAIRFAEAMRGKMRARGYD
jgi:flagellar biosynthetic protein FlhB